MNLPTQIIPQNIYLILFIVLVVVLSTIIVLLLVFVLSNTAFKNLKYPSEIKESALEDALKIVDSARLDALKILMHSQKKANSLVDDMRDVNHDVKKSLFNKLHLVYERYLNEVKDLGEDIKDTYKSTLEAEIKASREVLEEATAEIKEGVNSQLNEFSEHMRQETFASQEKVEGLIKEKYEEVEKEIQAYKQSKIQKIEDDYLSVLAAVYAEVIGKQIGQIESEKLILQMIKESLKKSGL
jgi:hypothetical protein